MGGKMDDLFRRSPSNQNYIDQKGNRDIFNGLTWAKAFYATGIASEAYVLHSFDSID